MITTPPPSDIDTTPKPLMAASGVVVERVATGTDHGLDVMSLTLVDADGSHADASLAEAIEQGTAWVAEAIQGDEGIVSIPLYGTHVVWSPRRAALIAAADRLPSLRAAVSEFGLLDGELRRIEQVIAAALPRLDGDAPLVYGLDDHSFVRRHELTERYREAISLRRRLAVLAPIATRPAPQPPTLAGQIGERLRERTRLTDRLDHAMEQADLVERVYAACGDRVGDYATSRRHTTLEWVIVLLLAAEVVLLCVDLLASRTP